MPNKKKSSKEVVVRVAKGQQFAQKNQDVDEAIVSLVPLSNSDGINASTVSADLESQTENQKQYFVTSPRPHNLYTALTMLASVALATGSVILFVDSNQPKDWRDFTQVMKFLGSVGINWGQNVYFTKETIDELAGLFTGKSKQSLGLRIVKVGTCVVLGVVATIPTVIAEYSESNHNLWKTLLQVCGLPMNVVGMFGIFDLGYQLISPLLRKRLPLYQLNGDEPKSLAEAQRALIITLQSVLPKIKSGELIVPAKGSLMTKIYLALQVQTQGIELTTGNSVLYYLSKSVGFTAVAGILNSALLLLGTLGYTANSKDFFGENGPISWLRCSGDKSWLPAVAVMVPQYGLSVLAGFGLARILGDLIFSTGLAEGCLEKLKTFLPVEFRLDNNLMRIFLILGFAATGFFGPFSGSTGESLFDKYFPDFSGKSQLSKLINGSVAGFNMYYFFAVAIMQGVKAYYRYYGTSEQRATAFSMDNFEAVLNAVKALSSDEMAYVLKELQSLEESNITVTNNLPKKPIDESTALLPDQKASESSETIIERAIGKQLASSLSSASFWNSEPKNLQDKRTLIQATNYQAHSLNTDPEEMTGGNEAVNGSRLRCPGMSCVIL